MLEALADTLASIGAVQALTIFAALLLASLLRAFTGFGSALAAVPVLALILPPVDAVVLAASLTLCANLLGIRSYASDYPPLQLLPLLFMSLLGTGFGVVFLSGLSVAQFQLLVGPAVLLACVVLTLYRPRPQARRRRWGALVGLLSGVMNGAFAIPGPPVVIYAMASEVDAARSRAMLMYFFMFSAVIALVVFAWAGYLSWRSLQLLVLALPAMLLGDQVGLRLFRRYGAGLYRRIALLTLYAIGLSITGRALVVLVQG